MFFFQHTLIATVVILCMILELHNLISFFVAGPLTWLTLTHTSNTVFNEIVLRNGAQLLLTGTGTLQADKIDDDGTGFIYTGPNSKLSITAQLGSCTQMYLNSVLIITRNTSSPSKVQRSLEIYGTFNLVNNPDLIFGESVGNLTMYSGSSPMDLRFRSLVVKQNSGVYFQNNTDGFGNKQWRLGGNTTNITFEANSVLDVPFTVYIRTKLLQFLDKSDISFDTNSYKSSVWNGLAQSSIISDEVVVNGELNAGNLSVGSGLEKFTVGPSGNFHGYVSALPVKEITLQGNVGFHGNTKLTGDILEVGPFGKVTLQNNTMTSIRVPQLLINGSLLLANLIQEVTWRKFYIGPSGNVIIKNYTDTLKIDNLDNMGKLYFGRALHIVGIKLTVGSYGSLSWETSQTAILRLHTVIVNGTFTAGPIFTGSGWELLHVGPKGDFSFSSNSTVMIDLLNIAGKVNVSGILSLQKRDNSGKSIIFIDSGGSMYLDSYAPCTDRFTPSGTSDLFALNVTLNGKFYGGRINVGTGWDNLVIGPTGDLAFIPYHHFKVNRITVQGKFRTDTNIIVKSKMSGTEELEFFKTEAGSHVEFSCSPKKIVSNITQGQNSTNSTKVTSTVSQLFAKRVLIGGFFNPRELYIGLGWDTFGIGSQGHFDVYPVGWYSVDTCDVLGKLTSRSRLELRGKSITKIPRVIIGPVGHLKSINETTDVIADDVIVKGKFETGILAIGNGLNNLNVSGTMTFISRKEFNIITTTISGLVETRTPFSTTGRLKGTSLIITNTGIMRIDYQNIPQQLEGQTNSFLLIEEVNIKGKAYFGSLIMTSNNVSISGLLSVDWGGALASHGPGAGKYSSAGSSGASHAGRGGRGNGAFVEKGAYGDIFKVGSWGSGGGSPAGGGGGRGGGRIQLKVNGSFTLDGKVTANGQPAQVSKHFKFQLD